MKKRLLITSIVMMLVCAVALSTATYAWFTSNASVSASTMTLKAASSDASSLGIGWTGGAAKSAIVSQIYETLKPMAPKDMSGSTVQALQNGVSTYENGASNIQFYTSTVKEKDSVISFNNSDMAADANVKPILYTQEAGKATTTDTDTTAVKSFYIKNLSKANTISSVTVSGLFPGSGSGEIKYAVVTETLPTPDKKYFTRNGDTYTEIKGTDRTALQNSGFSSDTTYYEIAYTFIKTQDKVMNKDTNYYKFVDVQEAGDNHKEYAQSKYFIIQDKQYVLSSAATIGENVKYYEKVLIPYDNTATDINVSTDPVYYEELSGDDMIRVALYTKRYTLVSGNASNDVTYYTYDAATGIMNKNGIAGSTLNGADLTGKGYYTTETNHKLLGILGKSATKLTPAASYDKNATYFTMTKVQDSNTAANDKVVNEWNFYNYFIQGDNGSYVKDTSYDNARTYYSATQTPTSITIDQYNEAVNAAEQTANSNSTEYVPPYYIAENTVANGKITADGAVRDLYYYTNVVPSITFAKELAPGEQIDIIAVVWLDGTMLDDTRAGDLAQVSILFNANAKVIGA